MIKFISIFMLTALLFAYGDAAACTVFNCARGNQVLVGNNEDWQYATDAEMWFVSPTGKNYGRLFFGWKQLLIFPQAQGGMNDQGLFLDWALCPKSVSPEFSFQKKIATFSFSDKLLAQCATVEEAVEWVKRYNILFIQSHIMLVDRSGNSAVIEWVDGEIKILRKINDCQVITNFWLSRPDLGNYPCPRYNSVTAMIEKEKEVSVESFASILKMAAQYERTADGKETGTIYSNVYDLTNGDVYIYYRRNFANPLKVNLAEELKKGNRSIKLKLLFRKPS